MKRNIIQIDENKCNGCGKCIPNCHEGALQLIDGKARLISDLFCDGLGACIGECPVGAITIVEREAEPYDERKVMDHIIRCGNATIKAHLFHLKEHGEFKLLDIALNCLKERGIDAPAMEQEKKLPCGCSGIFAGDFKKGAGQQAAGGASALQQWPIQLKLLNPDAACFDQAELLIAADCVAYAYGDFHKELLQGKKLIVFCPKLDSGLDSYVEKLSEIFRRHTIKSVTVARMEVPCCGATVMLVQKALQQAGVSIDLHIKTIGINGTTAN